MSYVGAVSGQTVSLDGPITYIGIGAPLRARKWQYDLNGLSISNVRRTARECEITATTTTAQADSMEAVFDADVAAKRPGVMSGDGWSQRAYVVESEPEDIAGGKCRVTLKVVLLDGAWRKPEEHHMLQASGDASGTKVYPYVYGYYYAGEFGVRYLTVPDAASVPFRFVFYGPAVSPQVRIGENHYQFNVTLQSGEHMIVESVPDATVTLVDVDGFRTDMFSCAVRGGGEGSGNYSFERIPPGVHEVQWSDMFGFDLVVLHEMGGFPYAAGNTG